MSMMSTSVPYAPAPTNHIVLDIIDSATATATMSSTIPTDVKGIVGLKKNPACNIVYSHLLADTSLSNRAFKYSDHIYSYYPGVSKRDLKDLQAHAGRLQASQHDVEASPISLHTFLQLQCLTILNQANTNRTQLRQRLESRPNLSYYTKYRKWLWLLDEWLEAATGGLCLLACLQLLLLPFVLLLYPVMLVIDLCCCRCCCSGNDAEKDFIRQLVRDFPAGNTQTQDEQIKDDLLAVCRRAQLQYGHYDIDVVIYQEDIGMQHVQERDVDIKHKHRKEDRFVIWYREKTASLPGTTTKVEAAPSSQSLSEDTRQQHVVVDTAEVSLLTTEEN